MKMSQLVRPHIWRTSSFVKVIFPKARRAAKRACSGLRPESCCSSASSSRWAHNSRSRSCWRDRGRHQRISALLGRPHDPRDRAGHFLPLRLLRHQLLLSSRGEPVILEFPLQILSRRLPFGRNPAFTFKPVERRIKGSMLHLQHLLGGPLYVLRDLMTVRRTKQECAQDQHVQGALQKFDPAGRFVWHSVGRYSTQILACWVDGLPRKRLAKR